VAIDNPDFQKKLVAELDSDLYAWLDQVPAHLKWDPQRKDSVFFQQSSVLYAAYYFTQVSFPICRFVFIMVLIEMCLPYYVTDPYTSPVYTYSSNCSQRCSSRTTISRYLHKRREIVCTCCSSYLSTATYAISYVHASLHFGNRAADRRMGWQSDRDRSRCSRSGDQSGRCQTLPASSEDGGNMVRLLLPIVTEASYSLCLVRTGGEVQGGCETF
jgi:hypothetical protein